MNDILYRADGPWAELTGLMLERLDASEPVLWIAFSQTLTIFANLDGLSTRTRQARPGAEQPGDGLPLTIEPPMIATACGYADGSGYRSTRPLLVATARHPDDIARLVDLSHDIARQLDDNGHDLTAAPDGHPTGPCPAPGCANRHVPTSSDSIGGVWAGLGPPPREA